MTLNYTENDRNPILATMVGGERSHHYANPAPLFFSNSFLVN